MMRRLAEFCLRRRRTVLACWLAALVVIGALAGGLGTEFRNNFDLTAASERS